MDRLLAFPGQHGSSGPREPRGKVQNKDHIPTCPQLHRKDAGGGGQGKSLPFPPCTGLWSPVLKSDALKAGFVLKLIRKNNVLALGELAPEEVSSLGVLEG